MYVVLKVYPLYIDLIMEFRAFLEIRMFFFRYKKNLESHCKLQWLSLLRQKIGCDKIIKKKTKKILIGIMRELI